MLLKNDIKKSNREVFGSLEERKGKAMARLEQLDHKNLEIQGEEENNSKRDSENLKILLKLRKFHGNKVEMPLDKTGR